MRMCSAMGRRVAHVSCLAEQAKILMDEGGSKQLGLGSEAESGGGMRSLCEQHYHATFIVRSGGVLEDDVGGRRRSASAWR